MSFICSWFTVSDEDLERYSEAYPGVAIEIELRKMEMWVRANPERSKRRWPRFICNWLSKTHGRLLEAQIAAEAREYLRTAQRRADAGVGRMR